jgi:NAD(P)-dependent dehydrogenase (short-subunit alcohol dehydrogenase family)
MKIAQSWTVSDIPEQRGKRVLITGANSGIGYQAAGVLARKGAQVVLACRDLQRAERAATAIRAEIPAADVEIGIVDLASLASVRAFARAELARQRPLHVLVNNAGVMAPRRRRTPADGLELQFGVNVLGHFALTALLFPAIEQAAAQASEPPRIVTVASIAHKGGRLAFDDLQSKRSYSPMAAYRQSKLADLVFALALARRLSAAQSPIMSIAAHPGVANTNLFRGSDRPAVERAARGMVGRLIGLFFNSDYAGALPMLFAATSDAAISGGYYGPRGLMEMRGERVGNARVARRARDRVAGDRLIEVCEKLTGVSLPV